MINSKNKTANNPPHYEIERKFLIEYPDIEWLEGLSSCQHAKIVQTYLVSPPKEERRVREWISETEHLYFQTVKRKISDIKRIETESAISHKDYQRLLKDADPTKRQICKTRYRLTFEDQCFEIDVYPFWQDKAIAEIELCDENTPIVFPKEIKVIREVTSDENYKNEALATIKSESPQSSDQQV